MPKVAGLNFGGYNKFQFHENNMSIRGDIDLNSMQGYANSLKEVLRHTMLSQEVVFRKQVHELHRLYTIQKTLMENFGWKELDGCNLWKVSAQSTLEPFTNPIQYSPLAKEKMFSRSQMLVATPSVDKDFLEENHSDYDRFQQRPFDLQLSADWHVNHVEEVKLTLSVERDTRKGGSGSKNTWFNKNTQSLHHVIDLEESTATVSNEDAKSVLTPICVVPISGERHYLRVPDQSNQVSRNSVKKDLSCGRTFSCSLIDGSESCAGQNSINQGYKERRGEITTDIFTKVKPFTSSKAFGLDLNRVQFDDSSYLNDPVVACLSTAGSSGAFDGLMGNLYEVTCPTATSCRKPHVNCFDESSTNLEQDDAANHTLMVPDRENGCLKFWDSIATFKGISQTEACPIDLESTMEPLSEICEDLNGDQRNSESGNIDLQLKFPKRNYTDITTAEVIETLEEDAVFPHPCQNGSSVEDANINKSPMLCMFGCVADDGSSGAKTMRSGTDVDGSNISSFCQFQKSRSSQVTETQSGEQELRSSDSSELKLQYCNKKKEESAGGDVLIQKAAEALLHLSLGNSTSNQDCCAKAGSNGIENEGRDQPQYSLDSYESIVLKLTEYSVDDYCVSSKPFEVNEVDKKDWGIKLRRGRRLKDFQRDILPGLASLSRHEICEDINIMETVIRSREYKRMRSKMTGGGNWFAPVKSRRSRLNYVGRRYYS